jgi:DNA-binding XRE family transcriptional regulator
MTIKTDAVFNRLKKFKHKYLLTWKQMAELIGVSYWTLMRVQQMKENKYNFSMKTLQKIKAFFEENK